MERAPEISTHEADRAVCETELIVFRRSAIHGTGGFARRAIAAGTPVIEYVGEKITKAESLRHCEANNDYIFTLDDEFDLLDILHALSDPTRMTIVQTLRAAPERACGTFPVDVAPSTLTHHFRVLREAGVIRQREDGNRRWTALRDEDLETRFPGLLDAIVTAYENELTRPR